MIGRYEVLGQLAVGGMAEIFLGRLTGPRGFERPVVIKRILPHLAREEEFVSMFLDEARIVAGIRNPNVVHVQELGHDDGELFLVMEYLEGESVSGLLRRTHTLRDPLDYGLCAYIMAEACSGLHAAHELEDADGKKRDVVHRDVSPQNVFVTYDGDVKVLDFGVATAADRLTKTEAGQFKGKFEYGSPEQCRGKPLDRRSDVFALGIVLYELSTGRRLFKRAGSLDTLRAICEAPIVSPAEVVEGYPPALAAIVMRALERNKEARFQTAAEMRRELLSVMRVLSSDVAPDEALAALMRRIFPERITLKKEMLRRVQTGAHVNDLPAAETDTTVEIPVAYEDDQSGVSPVQAPSGPVVQTQTASMPRIAVPEVPSAPVSGSDVSAKSAAREPSESSEMPVIAPARRSPSRTVASVAALVLACALAGAGFFFYERAHATEEPRASVAPEASQVSVAAFSIPSAPSASASEVAAAPLANDVIVRIDTVPSGAHVFVGAEDRGISPIELHVPKATADVPIEVRREGFVTIKDHVVPDVDQRLRLTLNPLPQKSAARPAPPAASSAHKPAFGRFD